MKHPERLAAGMADINEMVLRYELPVSSPRWSMGRYALNALVMLIGGTALCAVVAVVGG